MVDKKQIDPGILAAVKAATNKIEERKAVTTPNSMKRSINLDPGYITLGKLVLASTKDHAHRIYLGQGIYAEVTLEYREGGWRSRDWTALRMPSGEAALSIAYPSSFRSRRSACTTSA